MLPILWFYAPLFLAAFWLELVGPSPEPIAAEAAYW
jgi:hypothetical protein